MAKKGGTTTQTNTSQPDDATQAYIEAYRKAATGNMAAAGDASAQMSKLGTQLLGSLPFAQGTGLTGLDAYFNPFESSVIGGLQTDFDRQRQLASNAAADQATKAGAFGGDRAAVLQANMLGDVNRSEASTLANVRSGGYEQAVQQLMADRARALGISQMGITGLIDANSMRQGGLSGLLPGFTPLATSSTQSTTTPGDPFGFWAGILGTVGGALIGGPAGAALGSQLGDFGLGQQIGQISTPSLPGGSGLDALFHVPGAYGG